LDEADMLEAQTLEHRWLVLDDGIVQGQLPYQLEFSSINDWEMISSVNGDNDYVAFIGNELLMPVQLGSQDGHFGGMLSFTDNVCRYVHPLESGISVSGWGRKVLSIDRKDGQELLFITSDKGIKTYRERHIGN